MIILLLFFYIIIMIPGFITLYKGEDNLPHLYFYRGYTDEGRYYYNNLDLSNCQYSFKKVNYKDKAEEYIFENEKITKIKCKLVNYKGKISNFYLELK